MSRKTNIIYGALLLLGAGLFQACEQDVLDNGAIPDRDLLIAQGRYLTARSADEFSLQDPTTEPHPFEVYTPYRLLAFSKPYDAANPKDETPATDLRFSKVAWEDETAGGLRFINLHDNPDKWFGFSAFSDEESRTDGLVSLDFYGFTYGDVVKPIPQDQPQDQTYIPLGGTELSDLTCTESVVNNQLNDLMRGQLLNQNIATAGIKSTEADGYQNPETNTQSVIPFKHCFSKLSFQVSQQAEEDEVDANGNPVPCFENLTVEKIEVTGTYQTGAVSLADGKVELDVSGENNGKIDRTLDFNEKFKANKAVPITNTSVGEMLLFPSDKSALKNSGGYKIGLKITVRSNNESDIRNMLVNTESPVKIPLKEEINGEIWFEGTIVKEEIINYYPDDKPSTLYLKQNTSYMLIIAFKKNSVRIITVIPMVEEWLPGEGTPENPGWQDQAIGQPQMFDNIVWSDRNLGADHYDAINEEFERSIGYFYQPGRNIPYYPFKRSDYINRPDPQKKHPTIDDLQKLQHFENYNTKWGESDFRFWPVVDETILHMGAPKEWVVGGNPQMTIPETMTEKNFDFVSAYHLGKDDNMKWDESTDNQPVSGMWCIPTSDQFLSIFPSTPHAGNIAFKTGGYNNNPMDWGSDSNSPNNPKLMDNSVKTLRVTVPYYYPGMVVAETDSKYSAWKALHDNEDPGTTHTDLYTSGGPQNNIGNDPSGDPEVGYASIYVISREEAEEGEDPEKAPITYLPEPYASNNGYWVKNWGTIYAIKRVYTEEAYRMRWRAIIAQKGTENPGYVIEICRYRCTAEDTFDEKTYKKYDWDHPAATIYFPVCGLGDHPGNYINYGIECQYATSDAISDNGLTSAVQIKVNGNNTANAYISVVKNVINRHFGMQIRPVGVGGR